MKKISTLFIKNPSDLGRVINEINPENEWVFSGHAVATQKYDGTACAIIKGELYKRYDAKINKKTGKRKDPPFGSIACQEPDDITGHQPFWVKCDRNNPSDKWHWEGFDNYKSHGENDYTYELCGPKIQGNPEKLSDHQLIPHGMKICNVVHLTFDGIKEYLTHANIEGIVFHHKEIQKMCKIRKSDFGISRI